ncbi:MAG: response regulator [Pseudomonadota bacterium]
MVDDDSKSLDLLTDLIISAGYRVRAIRDPLLALESALASPPELMLLTVSMQGIDGFELCQQLKQDRRTIDIPILFVSSSDDADDRVRGFQVGSLDYISTELEIWDNTIFPPQVSIVLFRVVQATLTNVSRHASASHVRVECQLSDQMVSLSIEDDSVGFDTALIENLSSHGIRGMYERAGSMGGHLQIESKINAGTTIKISLPMNGHENHE